MINIIFGISYSGKTTFYNFLKQNYIENKNYIFIDLDNFIEEKQNKKIKDIILKNKVSYFRKIERTYLEKLILEYKNSNKKITIFLGGGYISYIKNLYILKKYINYIKLYKLDINYNTYLYRLKKYNALDKPLSNNSYVFFLTRTKIYYNIKYKTIKLSNKNNIKKDIKILKKEIKL